VQNCHPPKSLHLVNQILADFKAGRRDVAEFWIEMGGRMVHIRYWPVRTEDGGYLGTLETVQDVTSIRQLSGEAAPARCGVSAAAARAACGSDERSIAGLPGRRRRPRSRCLIEIPRRQLPEARLDRAIDFVSPLPCPFNYGSVPTHIGWRATCSTPSSSGGGWRPAPACAFRRGAR